jgi:hypothetical protein
MRMLGLCIRRLNARVAELRRELNSNLPELDACLSGGSAFGTKDKELPYELLLDMDSLIFETRSLYEITGKFLVELFQLLFDRTVTESELQSLLTAAGIDTRWIAELRESRKLFFHQTAPWPAVEVQRDKMIYDPILLKRHTTSFNPDEIIRFNSLREIYEGFVNSATELHRYIMEQIRVFESRSTPP